MMELTSFIVSHRNEALLIGDYGSYRAQLSRRLLTLRRKLGRTTPKGRKYATKAPVTAEEIASNSEFAYIFLLTAERAWAHAMYMKSLHAADSSEKAIAGSTRSHVISRLRKAEKEASLLADLLSGMGDGISGRVILEALAYRQMLLGTLEFESQKWERCLQSFSAVHTAYRSLAQTADSRQTELFRELLTSTVEPSIRYAAYKLGQPRTISIGTLASKYSKKSSLVVQKSLELDSAILDTTTTGQRQEKEVDSKDAPKTISWRSRKVAIEDANIAQSLAQASEGEKQLEAVLKDSSKDATEKAAAYDEVLTPSQDAVDATKTAIDELTADGVSQGDPRIQSLYITRTAVNYALVGWRVGRTRLLCGKDDGAHLDTEIVTIKTKRGNQESVTKLEGKNRKLTRLRERVVHYESILQSLESIKELPGVAADASLLDEVESKKSYFAALRCISIARSHDLQGHSKNALALFSRAQTHASKATPSKSSPSDSPSNMEITAQQVRTLKTFIEGLVTRSQALVEIERINSEAANVEKAKITGSTPLIDRLDEYPPGGADLTNLVNYPPKLRPIPVKPIFLDLAWNYIDYPGRQVTVEAKRTPVTAVEMESAEHESEEKPSGRRGWFGWGR